MKGAIFFATKYGSTAQYAAWIAEATGLPAFDVRDATADPADYDFLVIGTPVIYFKLAIRKWVDRHWSDIAGKSTILFTVSGAPGGGRLDAWVGNSLPKAFVDTTRHVALRGRQVPGDLSWFDWIMLRIGAMMNPDPVARREELKGFDFMDPAGIAPVVERIREIQAVSG